MLLPPLSRNANCAKLEQIFNEELIPEIVSERLAQDSTLTPADRQLLSAVLIEYPLNLDALRKSARAISTKEGATPEELRRARRQAQAALKIEGGNAAKPTAESAGDLGLLALLEYRLGNAAASADILKTLLPKIREVQGFNNLGELALAGLAEHAHGRDDDAKRDLQRMRDLDRPQAKWDAYGPLEIQAKRLAETLILRDPSREELKEAFLQIENDGWIRQKLDPYIAGRLPDCRDVEQREDQPGPYDVDLSLKARKAYCRLQFQDLNNENAHYMHDDWDIQIRGDSAELSCTTIVFIPGTWKGSWAVKATLQRVDGKWKIAGTRSFQTLDAVDGKLVKLDSAYWLKKDQAVTEAKDDRVKLTALSAAKRY